MSMTLIDPGGRGGSTDRTLAPRLDDVAGRSIGLLSNGKANADVLLNETAALFARDFGCEVRGFINKGNASRPALSEHHRELADCADFLITAVGD